MIKHILGTCGNGFLKKEYEHNHVINHKTGKTDLLPKVHIVVANLKMWLSGTYNCLPAKHLQRYIDEFVFCFNIDDRILKTFSTNSWLDA